MDYREHTYDDAASMRKPFSKGYRPSDKEMIASHMIDRALRPLFPSHWSHEITLTANVFSMDRNDLDPEVLAINAVSGALSCSDIPWYGPIGACKIAKIGKEWILHPSLHDQCRASFILTFVGTLKKVISINGYGKQVGQAKELLNYLYEGFHWRIANGIKSRSKNMWNYDRCPIRAHEQPASIQSSFSVYRS